MVCVVMFWTLGATSYLPHRRAAFRVVGGASCDTQQENSNGAYNASSVFNDNASSEWLAQAVIYTSTNAICKFDVQLEAVGSPTGNMSMHMYSGDPGADEPLSNLDSSTDTLDLSTIATGATNVYTFTGLAVEKVIGHTNWWVLECDTAGDGSNFIRVHRSSVGEPAGESIMISGDGTTWGTESSSRHSLYNLYSL